MGEFMLNVFKAFAVTFGVGVVYLLIKNRRG